MLEERWPVDFFSSLWCTFWVIPKQCLSQSSLTFPQAAFRDVKAQCSLSHRPDHSALSWGVPGLCIVLHALSALIPGLIIVNWRGPPLRKVLSCAWIPFGATSVILGSLCSFLVWGNEALKSNHEWFNWNCKDECSWTPGVSQPEKLQQVKVKKI